MFQTERTQSHTAMLARVLRRGAAQPRWFSLSMSLYGLQRAAYSPATTKVQLAESYIFEERR